MPAKRGGAGCWAPASNTPSRILGPASWNTITWTSARVACASAIPRLLCCSSTATSASGFTSSKPESTTASARRPCSCANKPTRNLHQPDHRADLGCADAVCAQRAQRGGARRFRKLLPAGVEDQAVMVVLRRREIQQGLQQPVDAGRPEQILSAHDVGHALARV